MLYDVAVIGAGVDGLCAAALLARGGLKTIVVELAHRLGGIAETVEFHPGFRAGRWADALPFLPHEIFSELGLSQRGAALVPQADSRAYDPDTRKTRSPSAPATMLMEEAARRAQAALDRARHDALAPPQKRWPPWAAVPEWSPWPGSDWGALSLRALAERWSVDAQSTALLAARALDGLSGDPDLRGSALHLLTPGAGHFGVAAGGWSALVGALRNAAEEAGATFVLGSEVAEIRRRRDRVLGIMLADGSDVSASRAICTWDAKRTFLSLFAWSELPRPLLAQAGSFRLRGTRARVLIALERAPETADPELLGPPLHVAPDLEGFEAADMACRAGRIADHLPATLRVPSRSDVTLAPPGGAVMAVTFGSVPLRPFDGAWTKEKRDMLRARALALAESVFPGTDARTLAAEVIVPSDVEEALALGAGDLFGGEIAFDQMFDARPWFGFGAPRTPIEGLYLAGPSTPAGVLATGASGVLAAMTLIADAKRRR